MVLRGKSTHTVANWLRHEGLRGREDTGGPELPGLLNALVCFGFVFACRLLAFSDPFLIFCFPVNSKIELNCKLEVDLLLFLALKGEVGAHFGQLPALSVHF